MEKFDTNSVTSCILSVISSKNSRVHFVGILGAGMLPLARLLARRGIRVSGTDRGNAENPDLLSAEKIDFIPYHTARGLFDADLVVYSLAVPNDAPELVLARGKGIPTVTRAQLLGAVASQYKTSVAVAGTHGKSTTVAILSHLLIEAGLSPTVVSGAALTTGDSLFVGGDELFVAEACEYKNAFHSLKPTVALITNIDYDHVDCFSDIEEVYSSFRDFAIPARHRVLNMECKWSKRLAAELSSGVISYGTAESDFALIWYSLGACKTDFLLKINGAIYSFVLPVAGLGCLYDAVGAIAAAHLLGVPVSNIRDSIATFSGIERRTEHLGTISGRPVYYDYAHHPTEIENTVDVLTRRHGDVAVIFRPHTYSRTAALMDGFVRAFSGVECLALLDVYAARENPSDGADSRTLKQAVGGRATLCNEWDALEYILSHSSGAIVLMGAGDVHNLLDGIKKRLD